MFDILFGWRKASKCKKLIRCAQCHLKLLKNKRYSIVRQLREDVAQLLRIGHEESAFNRVEQLYKDESIMAVYELLDHFCEFIIVHLSYIRRHKDCPNDINEAVSSLIFASARCGDLPELRVIRKLFGERYGQKFAMAAVELFPGNLVNRQIKEKLSIKSVPDDVKHRLVDEIFRDCCLQPGPLALEYSSEWQRQQVKENGRDQVQERDLQTLEHKVERMAAPSSSKSSSVIYHDDIEEFQSPMSKEGNFQDQRLFMFKSSLPPKVGDSWIGKAGSRRSRKNGKASGKRLRKRSVSRENRSMKEDVEGVIYYGESCWNFPNQNRKSHHHRKNPKKIRIEESQQSYYAQKKPTQPCYIQSSKSMVTECSLEHPCYFCTSDDRDEVEIPPWKQKRRITTLVRRETESPYLRAMTMPPERRKDGRIDNISRSNSCPFQEHNHLNHVHPKLPDYDELEAKFMALKKAYLQNKHH